MAKKRRASDPAPVSKEAAPASPNPPAPKEADARVSATAAGQSAGTTATLASVTKPDHPVPPAQVEPHPPKPAAAVPLATPAPSPQPKPFGTQIVLPVAVEKLVVPEKTTQGDPGTAVVKPAVTNPVPVEVAKPEAEAASPARPTSPASISTPALPLATTTKPGLSERSDPPKVAAPTPRSALPAEPTPAKREVVSPSATDAVAVESKPVVAKAAATPAPTAIPDTAAKPVDRAKPPAATVLGETKPAPSRPRPVSEEKIIGKVPTLKTEQEAEAQPATPESAEPPPRPSIPAMYVVMIAPEMAPVAKVGGLGDVVYGLARELEIRGNSVEIILPKYNNMRYDHIWGLTKVYENLWVPWYGGAIHTSVWFGFVHGRKCFFIDPHSNDNFFNRGVYYGNNDDVFRFAFFCRAALEFMLKTNKHPEVIHCHDWQTALVPVLLYEMYQHLGMRHSRVCFTVHNFRHQGVTGGQILQATGLNRPEHFFHYDRMRDNHNPGALNLMKAGIVYSNFVTTVSPRHAWEAKDAGQAHGLEPTLHTHHYKFGGVLNGLDYDQFNPENDPHIPAHFNVTTIERKYDNKRALRQRFWLADNEKPILAFIGRLDQQKGLELVRHAIFYAINHRAQFVLLGNSPERGINDHFLGLKQHLNNNPDCHLEIGYHEELAHLIYAGADLLVVPSRYEPCGLTQLIALRYGTVPVVRAVGGLVDTVFDKDYSNRPLHERNGYVFEHGDNAGLESALERALACYYQFPGHWRQLMVNAMKCDNSWNHPGQHYVNIYDYIRDK